MRVRLFVVALLPALVAIASGAGASDLMSVVGTTEPAPGLFGVSAVRLSPDDAFVYAVGSGGKSGVAVYAWDPVARDVEVVQTLVDDVDVAELEGASDLTSSPGGEHVYVAAEDDDAVVVFVRDPVAGTLAHLESHVDGLGGVDGLDGARAVVVSPDGAFVYAGGRFDDAIALFSRDGGTGALTFLGTVEDDTGGVDGLDGVLRLALSPDGAHLYALGRDDAAIAVFARDAGTGVLAFVEAETDDGSIPLDLPWSLWMAPDGAHVYAGASTDAFGSYVLVFERDGSTGELSWVSSAGSLGHAVGAPDVGGSGDGLFLYAMTGDVHVYARSPATGLLSPVEIDPSVGGGPVAIPASGTPLFAGGTGISVFDRDGGTGEVDFIGRLAARTDCGFYSTCGGVVSPDGLNAYFVGDDHLHVYSRDPADGTLGYLESFYDGLGGVDGLDSARQVTVSPDGAHVYVTSGEYYLTDRNDDAVAIFARDPGAGTLTFVGAVLDGVDGVTGLAGADAVEVSRDGAHVYVRSLANGALVAFERDSTTGALTFLESHFVGTGGLAGSEQWIAITTDGLHLYTGWSDEVQPFDRDPGTGALTAKPVVSIGEPISHGVLSPDDAHLYLVTTAFPAGLHAYARDESGALTFVDVERRGEDRIVGMWGPRDLWMAADGRALLIGDENGPFTSGAEGMSVFRRDVATGEVTFIQTILLGADGEELLPARGTVFPGPDGDAYVALPGESAMRRTFGCATEPMSGCRTAAKSSLQVTDDVKNKKDRITWSLTGVEPTTHAEFDPAGGNHMTACVYDESGPTPVLVLGLLAEADKECSTTPHSRPCWSDKIKLLQYTDQLVQPDGVSRMSLTPGDEARVKVKAAGIDLGWETETPFPLALPVRAQLQAANGLCWESVYAEAQKNDAKTFKAKTK